MTTLTSFSILFITCTLLLLKPFEWLLLFNVNNCHVTVISLVYSAPYLIECLFVCHLYVYYKLLW